MQPAICWARGLRSSSSDPRLDLLRTVLAAALRTPYAARHAAALRKAEHAAAAGQPLWIVLECLPILPPEEFLAAAPPRLFPADHVASFPNGWRARLGFSAEALEGSAAALLGLKPLAGRLSTARRLLVRTLPGQAPLTDSLRDRLWTRFELPVFEQIRAWDGELLASECPAHQGLHVEPEAEVELLEDELVLTSLRSVSPPLLRLATGWRATLDRERCPCGGPSFRIQFLCGAGPWPRQPGTGC